VPVSVLRRGVPGPASETGVAKMTFSEGGRGEGCIRTPGLVNWGSRLGWPNGGIRVWRPTRRVRRGRGWPVRSQVDVMPR